MHSSYIKVYGKVLSPPLIHTEQYTVDISSPGNPVAGQDYTLTCEVDVGEGTPTLQWTGPGVTSGEASEGTQMQSSTTFTLTLTFSPVKTSHAGQYTCQSTVVGAAVERTVMADVNVQSEWSKYACDVVNISLFL